MTFPRMDNIAIVFDDLDAAIAFFTELGLELEGRSEVEGGWSARIVGIPDQRVEIAMMRTPDGHGRLELMRYVSPKALPSDPDAPVNTLGLRRILFEVADLEDTQARLLARGATLVGELTRIGDSWLMSYLRGPEGVIVALAQQLG